MAIASWPPKVAAWNDDAFLLVPNGYRAIDYDRGGHAPASQPCITPTWIPTNPLLPKAACNAPTTSVYISGPHPGNERITDLRTRHRSAGMD
jgi:hypothetical protein